MIHRMWTLIVDLSTNFLVFVQMNGKKDRHGIDEYDQIEYKRNIVVNDLKSIV
jgi:hypothetical protein